MKKNDEEYMYALSVINELYCDDEITPKEHINRMNELDVGCED